MPDKSTSTEDLWDVVPKLINDMNKLDKQIDLLNKLLEERTIQNELLQQRLTELNSYISSIN